MYLSSSQLLVQGSPLAKKFWVLPTSSAPKEVNFKEFLLPEESS